jgi:DNA-binding helix-hairpin-helix protein with protein kinase domain
MVTEKDLPIQVRLQSDARPLILLKKLAGGGEGFICGIKGNDQFVAKIYTKPVPVAKLNAMLSNPPSDPMASENHTSIAWPLDLIIDLSGKPIGFLMPKAGSKIKKNENLYTLNKLLLPIERKKELPDFSFKDICIVAYNFCHAVQALHAKGYVIGDINESNALITEDAYVCIIDTDSMQVKSEDKLFRCTVGKAEYTPRELQGKRFEQVDRSLEHDHFSLAILVFQLLMNGMHPFYGAYKGANDPPSISERIKNGICPFFVNYPDWSPPPTALSINTLPPNIVKLFRRCFVDGHNSPSHRPNDSEWIKALYAMHNSLIHCSVNSLHFYGNHQSICPWCKLKAGDPFPMPKSKQTSGGQIKRDRAGASPVIGSGILGKPIASVGANIGGTNSVGSPPFATISKSDMLVLSGRTAISSLAIGFLFWLSRRIMANSAPDLNTWLLSYPIFDIESLSQVHWVFISVGSVIVLAIVALYKYRR